jgi:hypothetical protein
MLLEDDFPAELQLGSGLFSAALSRKCLAGGSRAFETPTTRGRSLPVLTTADW